MHNGDHSEAFSFDRESIPKSLTGYSGHSVLAFGNDLRLRTQDSETAWDRLYWTLGTCLGGESALEDEGLRDGLGQVILDTQYLPWGRICT